MSKKRPDNFHAYLVRSAKFVGKWEMPQVDCVPAVPEGLVLFSEMKNTDNFNQWVHFYTDDRRFEALWSNPTAHLFQLQKFEGIVSPDFSMCSDFPLAMQMWNSYRNHALAYWLSTKGIRVIPNVRWGSEDSYEFCFDGFPSNSVVSVGSNGCLRDASDFEDFRKGLAEMYRRLTPHTILVYGTAPDSLFAQYTAAGVRVIPFQSEMKKVRAKNAIQGVA